MEAKKSQEFVCYDVLKEYGVDIAAASRHYRAYVEACVLEDDTPLLEAMAASRYARGHRLCGKDRASDGRVP